MGLRSELRLCEDQRGLQKLAQRFLLPPMQSENFRENLRDESAERQSSIMRHLTGEGCVTEEQIKEFWKAVLEQDAGKMAAFFEEEAFVSWHCTNERFTVSEYIKANCEYPGEWDGVVERIEIVNDKIITVVHVFTADRELSFHVVSFMKIRGHKIASLDEYWGTDESAPQWRLDKRIGTVIRRETI